MPRRLNELAIASAKASPTHPTGPSMPFITMPALLDAIGKFATPLLIVRFETYLSTVLLAMDALEILKLERKDKENILTLINSDVDSMPILKGIDPEKLKIITSLWLKP